MGDWENIFKEKGTYFYEPDKDISNSLRLLKKEKIKKILDLGCGTGRHSLLLAKSGFDVYSMDISKTGIAILKKNMKKQGLTSKTKLASFYSKFPFKNEFFDAVVSTQAIHHNYHDNIIYTISEITRVLKPNGLLLITMPHRKNQKDSKKSKQIDKNTYVPIEGQEKGLVHYLYNQKMIKKDFSKFKIIVLKKTEGHYFFIAEKKKN